MTPKRLIPWLSLFIADSLEFPDLVELVPSVNLNPEDENFYEGRDKDKFRKAG